MSVISYTQEMNHTLCVVDLGVLKKSVTESYILNNMSATSEKWNFLVLLLIAYHKLWRMNKMPSPFFRIVSISNGEVCMVKFLARVGHFCQSGSGTWRFHFKDL